MKPHEIQFFKGRSGSIFATHPGLQGVYNAQTGNVYPDYSSLRLLSQGTLS